MRNIGARPIGRTCVVVTALCNQPEAFASDLGDDLSRYTYCIVRTKTQLGQICHTYRYYRRQWLPKLHEICVAVHILDYFLLALPQFSHFVGDGCQLFCLQSINQSKFIFQAMRNNYNIINVTALEKLPEKHYAQATRSRRMLRNLFFCTMTSTQLLIAFAATRYQHNARTVAFRQVSRLVEGPKWRLDSRTLASVSDELIRSASVDWRRDFSWQRLTQMCAVSIFILSKMSTAVWLILIHLRLLSAEQTCQYSRRSTVGLLKHSGFSSCCGLVD